VHRTSAATRTISDRELSNRDDAHLIADLRGGSEPAFMDLVERYHTSLLRLARLYVDSNAAEDVVQETWLGVLRGLDTFEGRASFKTWLFRILANRARTRAVRESRSVAFSSLVRQETDSDEPAVDPSRFRLADDAYPGHWLVAPAADELPEERLLADELSQQVQDALTQLPPVQAEVVRLRDIEGLTSEAVCVVLGVSEGNQRVLLHRGRSKIRGELERYIAAQTR
jgi:RNA polymerase sigma-70 factor (ECF subfamily)